MAFFEELRPALTGLFATCLVVSAADALFDDRADGLRLVCGLAVAVCVARIAAELLGELR